MTTPSLPLTNYNTSNPLSPFHLPQRIWNQANELALERPLAALITAVVFGVLGVLGIAAAAGTLFLAPIFPIAAAALGAASALSFGLAATQISAIISQYKYLKQIGNVEHHNMAERTFVPGKCWGGELTYVGDVPVLKLTASDPFQMGYAQGYLTGKNIQEAWRKYLFPAFIYFFQTPDAYSKVLEESKKVHIPEKYRKEMEGIAAGYNQWLSEHQAENGLFIPGKKITVEDLIAFHAFTDLLKSPMTKNQPSPLGCSTIALKDSNGVVIGRNLDWPSLNIMGKECLVISRQPEGKKPFVSIGFPGSVGVLTGMNGDGLCTVVNEAGTQFREGRVPYILLHRELLENCSNVGEARKLMQGTMPASSHLMTLADPHNASAFQFYPERGKEVSEVALKPLPGTPFERVVSTNHFVDSRGVFLANSCWADDSYERRFFLEKTAPTLASDPRECIVKGLQHVQSDHTIQTIFMDPLHKRFEVAFDNREAGSQGLRPLSWNQLFS